MKKSLGTLTLIILFVGFSAYANASTGTLRGVVIKTGAAAEPIEGVRVVLTGPRIEEFQTEKTTDKDGRYEFKDLQPGPYMISLYKRGYRNREGLVRTVTPGTENYREYKMTKKDTPITYLQRMGIMGPLLLLCSIAMFGGIVIMLVYIIIRVSKLSQSKREIRGAMSQVTTSLQNENVLEAVSTCEDVGGVANMLKAGLIRAQNLIDKREEQPREIQPALEKAEVQEAIEEAGVTAKRAFAFHWEFLAMMFAGIGVMALLFGLLGSVTGMIKAFTTIALEGTGDPKMLAGGISQALLTASSGLTVLIPCLILCGVAYIAYIIFGWAVNNYVLQSQRSFVETINSLLLSRGR